MTRFTFEKKCRKYKGHRKVGGSYREKLVVIAGNMLEDSSSNFSHVLIELVKEGSNYETFVFGYRKSKQDFSETPNFTKT